MESTSPIHLGAYWRILRTNRNFRLLWFAQIVSEIGDWLYMVAVFSLLLELTGSARIVAFAFVMQVLPQCFVAPSAGVINDRLSRKRVMIYTDWARALIVLSMAFTQSQDRIWMLFVLLFLETVGWALFEPAHNAVIPNITSPSETLVANGLSSTTWSFSLAIGSALGGVLAAYLGRSTVFALNSLSFVASALLIGRMRFTEPHMADLAPMKARDLTDFSPILEGIRYVSKDSRLLATMFVKCGTGILGTNWVLLPILGQKVFPLAGHGVDPRSGGMLSMSLLMGCRGIGSLIGPLAASFWTGNRQPRFRTGILFGFLIAALGYILLGYSTGLGVACLCVGLAHAGGAMAWVFSSTLLQIGTEDRFRGRVFSAEFAFSMLVLSIVSFSAGVLADKGVRVRSLAACTGLLMIIPSVWWAASLRLWRREKSLPEE